MPATGLPSASVQSKAAPPQAWTSTPKCRLYQARSDGASLALKKMPLMPKGTTVRGRPPASLPRPSAPTALGGVSLSRDLRYSTLPCRNGPVNHAEERMGQQGRVLHLAPPLRVASTDFRTQMPPFEAQLVPRDLEWRAPDSDAREFPRIKRIPAPCRLDVDGLEVRNDCGDGSA